MGLGAVHTRSVKTKRKFSIDEIYDILEAEANLPAEPYITGKGLMRGLFVPGMGKFDVCISSMGKKISCSEYVRQGEQAKSLTLNVVTNSWSDILDGDSLDNKAVTDAVADEVERLFANRA
ncbi:hypothetical protein [Gordonibacter sp.]|uniref:hypothetical protein n=1 Tax=Gordonibacter sp. TaxID=1968902 RepID=UPI002FCA0E34